MTHIWYFHFSGRLLSSVQRFWIASFIHLAVMTEQSPEAANLGLGIRVYLYLQATMTC